MTTYGQLDADSTVVVAAHEEMEFKCDVEGQFGNTFDASIPCQLRFTEPPSQNTDRFHETLADNGYRPVDVNPDRKQSDGAPHYHGEVCSDEHYSRVDIRLIRDGVVRLFPHDEYVPTRSELAGILNALEIGFNAPLTHDPIE